LSPASPCDITPDRVEPIQALNPVEEMIISLAEARECMPHDP
jgi:hypothetical protein